MTAEGFELQISCIRILLNPPSLVGLGNYFVCKRLEVQTLLWLLEFVIEIILGIIRASYLPGGLLRF